MSKAFLEDLNIKPDTFLEVGSGSQGEQTGQMLMQVEKQLTKEKPNLTLVEGDTNSSLAGALASSKLQIPVGHVEAGCRSFEFYMPEEINRKLIDHCAELLFAPTQTAYNNLRREGIANRAYIVGSTLTDICQKIAESTNIQKQKIMETLGLGEGGLYALATIHRRENIEDKEKLTQIMEALSSLPIRTIFPVHPHTSKKLGEFDLSKKLKRYEHLILSKPLSYSPFIYLLKHARLAITDSGGIQEEASILNTPCITTRSKTEWPETVKAGKNILTGPFKDRILRTANKIIFNENFYKKMRNRKSPFRGGAGAKIAEIVENFITTKQSKR